jgi:hypothetical protein
MTVTSDATAAEGHPARGTEGAAGIGFRTGTGVGGGRVPRAAPPGAPAASRG